MARRFPSLKTMRAEWDEPTSRTVKIPSIQTMLLIVLLLGAMTAIVWVSIAVQLEIPHTVPVQPETAATDGPAAWLSAWSTFWGAVAGGIGAIGTAGALWLGAVTFFRQVRDQHRAQSSRVIVVMDKGTGKGAGYLPPTAIVRNLSDLPIYKVRLRAAPNDAFDDELKKEKPLLVGEWPVVIPGKYIEHSVHVEFQDSAGTTWIRWVGGGLAEKKGEVYEIE